MSGTQTTEAGRDIMLGNDPALTENATAKFKRKQEEAKRAAAALNGDAPLFDDAPAPKPAKPARPTSLAEAAPWLLKPFHRADIEIKISATNRDKTKGLASPYADMRCYFTRLDQICGVENWSHTITLSERGAVCALTLFGVTKSAVGDYPQAVEANPATSAEAQAFKRACAAFGLGRYLYTFSDVWGALTQDGKKFIDPSGLVRQMYDSLDYSAEK